MGTLVKVRGNVTELDERGHLGLAGRVPMTRCLRLLVSIVQNLRTLMPLLKLIGLLSRRGPFPFPCSRRAAGDIRPFGVIRSRAGGPVELAIQTRTLARTFQLVFVSAALPSSMIMMTDPFLSAIVARASDPSGGSRRVHIGCETRVENLLGI